MLGSSRGRRLWPSAVIFDLDGTLVDSAGDIAASLNQLLAIKGLSPFAVKEVIDFIGDGVSALIERAFSESRYLLDADQLSALLSTFRTIYESRLTELTKTYVGVIELVSDLCSRGIVLGVCTNKEQNLAQGIIDGLGLRDCFAVVVGGMPARPPKPSPLPLLETISRLGVSPHDTIMVGDSIVDVDCARNAGVAFVGVTFGYSRTPISSLGARIAIDSYSEFASACDFLRSSRQ